MRIAAAVARATRSPLTLTELELDEPRGDELLVRMVSSGVCHTDLVARDEPRPPGLPAVLGHEGAGIVERVGVSVRSFSPGDRVVLSFARCGACQMCVTGRPAYCVDFMGCNFSGRRPDGSPTLWEDGTPIHGNFFGQSSFATYALAHEDHAVKVGKDFPLEILGPLACGFQTGAGAVYNGLKVPAGSSIGIFGAGSVGLAALLAADAVGCSNIVAVDVNPTRLKLARELGATEVIDGANNELSKEILARTGGIDFAVETTGHASVVRAAIESLRVGGICGLHAAPHLGGGLDVSALPPGRTVTFLVEGDAVPGVFLPMLLDLYDRGRFPFDRLIRLYSFRHINQAIADSISGCSVKPVLTFDS
jgi:aryl-alcohol dehydrogenase